MSRRKEEAEEKGKLEQQVAIQKVRKIATLTFCYVVYLLIMFCFSDEDPRADEPVG